MVESERTAALTGWVKALFKGDHPRTARLRRQTAYTVILRAVNSLVGFVAVPLYLSYLTDTAYGIWLTVSSVVAWIGIFDLGLGQGLRNKFAEAKARGDFETARMYVSTSYAIMGAISLLLFLVFFLTYRFFDWASWLNAPESLAGQTRSLVLIAVGFFSFQLTLQLVKMVVIGDQRPAYSQLINTVSSVAGLVALFLLDRFASSSLEVLAYSICGINLAVPAVASLFLFFGPYQNFRPSLSLVKISRARALMSLGWRFFIMQGGALVVMMTDNLIIAHWLGPEEVPPYQVALKYFGIVGLFYQLVLLPYWSAFTEAFVKGETSWIKKRMKELMKLLGILVFVVMILLLISENVYSWWLQDKLSIGYLLSACMAVWTILSMWAAGYGQFLAGSGKITLSMYHSVAVMVINIPLSIFLASGMGWGAPGVIIASTICLVPRLFFQPRQYRKLIEGKATGIWNQ